MKQIKIFGILFFLIISASVAVAQKPTIEQDMDRLLQQIAAELGKGDITKPKEVKKVADSHKSDDVFDQGLELLNAETERMKKEIEQKKKEYIPVTSNKPQQIDKDLLALLAKMPEPVTSLSAAKKVMMAKSEKNIFNVYIKGLEDYQKQLEETIRKTAVEARGDDEAVKNEITAMQNHNNSPMMQAVMQEAGGMENLQKMSPQERAALGKRIAEKMKQNPSAYNGQESDPKKAFSKKMMTDASYAARYNHMNPQQQKEEYELFKQENGFINNGSEKSNNNRAFNSIPINKRLTAILDHMNELDTIIHAAQTRTNGYFDGVNKELADQHAALIEALPVIRDSEVGPYKDRGAADIAFNIVQYSIKVQAAVAYKEVWKRKVEALKVTIDEYNWLVSDYWGKDKATDKWMAQHNQTPPAILAGMCKGLIELAEYAKFLTNQNATAQRTYDQNVLGFTEAQSE